MKENIIRAPLNKKGMPHGTCKSFNEEGWLEWEGNFKDGMLHGRVVSYFEKTK